ncbi:hypothetical protein [Chishuiella sp.]|uniref:hypothetical protein n=1 Tax=Chishuiella sp. TaxID=1969467 RepID=UPI0028B07E41|nr:hypothetical protein [Chishuiella sp.]
MLNFLLMLIGLISPNNNNTTTLKTNSATKTSEAKVLSTSTVDDSIGETGQIPPKKNN